MGTRTRPRRAAHSARRRAARIEELDPDAEIYVICRQGGRSLGAVEYLARIGYDTFQVAGGMVAWQKHGLPLVSERDEPAKIY